MCSAWRVQHDRPRRTRRIGRNYPLVDRITAVNPPISTATTAIVSADKPGDNHKPAEADDHVAFQLPERPRPSWWGFGSSRRTELIYNPTLKFAVDLQLDSNSYP